MGIDATIGSMKELISKETLMYIGPGSNPLIYTGRSEIQKFTGIFNEGVSIKDIEYFEKKTGCIIPQDYREFLHITDGIRFLHFNESTFYTLDAEGVLDSIQNGYYRKGIYPIIYLNDDIIFINSEDVQTGRYLYACNTGVNNKFIFLNSDFETFFERLLMTNFQNYWNWVEHKKYYDFSGK